MPACIQPSTSFASAATSLRAWPRNTTPNTLTKQVAASAPAKASMAAENGTIAINSAPPICGAIKAVWNVSHSDTKPLNGGRAEIETAATRKNAAVTGIR